MLTEEQQAALFRCYEILLQLPAQEVKEDVSDVGGAIECAEAEVEYEVEEEEVIPMAEAAV